MNKNRFKTAFFVLLMLAACLAVSACGSAESTADEKNNTTEYESENLGFSISMNENLFSVITYDGYKEGTDVALNVHKWKNTVSAQFDDVSVPLFYVNVYDGEFDEETVKNAFPNDAYLGTAEGYTYTMTFSVDGDGAALADKTAYQEMMDKYVYDLPDYTVIYGYGNALSHGADGQPQLAWVKSYDKDGNSLVIDPVVMVTEDDQDTVAKMQAAGITPDFSIGYMIWNETEEQTAVPLSDNLTISLLGDNFEFAESSLADLQSRIESGNLLISYVAEDGAITQIYEQYQDVQ